MAQFSCRKDGEFTVALTDQTSEKGRGGSCVVCAPPWPEAAAAAAEERGCRSRVPNPYRRKTPLSAPGLHPQPNPTLARLSFPPLLSFTSKLGFKLESGE